MSEHEVRCPTCDGPMETRTFIDTWDPDGEPLDVSQNWWCPACRLRWLSMDFEPVEAEKVG